MFAVRFHGRGGQGVVTAAEMLSQAAFDEGRHAQAFPSFGSERMGAPVVSYCRIDDRAVRRHDPIDAVDALVIQDPTLLHELALFAGLRPGGWVLINSSRPPADLGVDATTVGTVPGRLLTVPATDLARRLIGRPLPNTALLGSLAAITGVVSVHSVVGAVHRRFGGPVAEANAAAVGAAAEFVVQAMGGVVGA